MSTLTPEQQVIADLMGEVPPDATPECIAAYNVAIATGAVPNTREGIELVKWVDIRRRADTRTVDTRVRDLMDLPTWEARFAALLVVIESVDEAREEEGLDSWPQPDDWKPGWDGQHHTCAGALDDWVLCGVIQYSNDEMYRAHLARLDNYYDRQDNPKRYEP